MASAGGEAYIAPLKQMTNTERIRLRKAVLAAAEYTGQLEAKLLLAQELAAVVLDAQAKIHGFAKRRQQLVALAKRIQEDDV